MASQIWTGALTNLDKIVDIVDQVLDKKKSQKEDMENEGENSQQRGHDESLKQNTTLAEGNQDNADVDDGDERGINRSPNESGGKKLEQVEEIIPLVMKVKKTINEHIEQLAAKNEGVMARVGNHVGNSVLKMFKYKTLLHVYMQDPMESFETNFTNYMSKKMNVSINIIHDPARIQAGKLLVVSPVSSRLQPDIDSALNGIEGRDSVAVLVLHCTRESSLPHVPTSTHLGTEIKYKNIQFIDMAFENTIYVCEMNKKAKKELSEFVKTL